MADRTKYDEWREAVWRAAWKMWEAGLVVASAGNVSARIDGKSDQIAITPTSIQYDVMKGGEIAIVDLASGRVVDSVARPSSELPMHLAVYRARPDVGAIVHTHAPSVSALSVLRRPLPPVIDEMTIYFGGTVEVADYAFTGSEELGRNVVSALGDRAGAILSNHGNVCVGKDLDEALHVATTMESCARIYIEALRAGTPVTIPADAIAAGRRLYELRKKRD